MSLLMGSVGRVATNRPNDVRLVQTLLNRQSIPGGTDKLSVDGRIGPKTIQRIEAFQRHVLKFSRPDGRVDREGRTAQHLIKNTSLTNKAKPVSSLTMSASGLTLLKSKESLALAPYDDQTGLEISNWTAGATIGYGHLIVRSEWNQYKNGISQAQADALFKSDLSPFVSTVRTSIKAKVSQEQFDALVILAFNIGRTAFSKSSVATLVNDPTAVTGYSSLKSAWMAWNKSQGKEMKGLANRRTAEWSLYERGIYR